MIAITLSGGLLGGEVVIWEEAVTADSNGDPGTVLELGYDVAKLYDDGSVGAETITCHYRVASISTRRIGGKAQTTATAVFVGEGQ